MRAIPAAFRLVLLSSCILVSVLASPIWSSDVQYLPERIGKAFIRQRDDYWRYDVPAKQLQEYREKLRSIAEWITAQPALSPPRGFNVRGWGLVDRSEVCPRSEPCRGTPVAAWFSVPLFEWKRNLITGKEYTSSEFSEDFNLHVNNPWRPIQNQYALEPKSVDGIKVEELPFTVDEKGNKFLFEPRHISDVDGCPLYEDVNGNRQCLVITKISRPLFLPLTREVYLRALIRWWGALLKSSEAAGPLTVAYEKFVAESQARLRGGQELYVSMKKSNPEKAETMRRQMEDTEQKVAADLKREMEKEQAARAKSGGKDASTREVLSRLQRQLATMTPAELSAQARYFQDGPLGKR